MNHLPRHAIDQYVGYMAIPETEDVPHDGGSGDTASVVETHREPGNRRLVLFCEIMPHHGLGLLAYFLKGRDHGFSLPTTICPRLL